jgi:hypothetical protein
MNVKGNSRRCAKSVRSGSITIRPASDTAYLTSVEGCVTIRQGPFLSLKPGQVPGFSFCRTSDARCDEITLTLSFYDNFTPTPGHFMAPLRPCSICFQGQIRPWKFCYGVAMNWLYLLLVLALVCYLARALTRSHE